MTLLRNTIMTKDSRVYVHQPAQNPLIMTYGTKVTLPYLPRLRMSLEATDDLAQMPKRQGKAHDKDTTKHFCGDLILTKVCLGRQSESSSSCRTPPNGEY